MSQQIWQTARFQIALDRARVMGIVNVTPDSFSDGGCFRAADAARRHCDQLLSEGVDILDIGGESTRPGSEMPTVVEELARVLPVVKYAVTLGVPVSVDTSRPEIIDAVLEAGVDIINDVRALTWPGALQAVSAAENVGLCLMHMQGEPATMQQHPHYDDVVAEVMAFLRERLETLDALHVARNRVVLDPGYGFGKNAEHHQTLWRGQARLLALGQPLLVGWSRKGLLGQWSGRPVSQRVHASVAAALASVARGARVVRVHDVAATVDALKIWQAAGDPVAIQD